VSQKVVESKDVERVLEELSLKAKKAAEARKRVEMLLNLLREEYEDKDFIRPLLGQIMEFNKPPDLDIPIDELLRVENSLDSYSKSLDEYVDKLSSLATSLEKMLNVLEKVESSAETLERWSRLIRNTSPHIFSENARLLGRCRKLLESPGYDIEQYVDELQYLHRELTKQLNLAKRIFMKRLKKIGEKIAFIETLFQRMRHLGDIQVQEKLQRLNKRLMEIKSIIERIESEPLSHEHNIAVLEKEIETILTEAKKMSERIMDRETKETLAALTALFNKQERALNLSLVVDYVSKRTGFSKILVLEKMYYLAAKNIISIKVKIE